MKPFIFNAPSSNQDQRKQAIISMITGGGAQPTTAGQGMTQGLSSMMGGLMLRQHNKGAFPAAPGGQKPGLATGIRNLFGNNGGLF